MCSKSDPICGCSDLEAMRGDELSRSSPMRTLDSCVRALARDRSGPRSHARAGRADEPCTGKDHTHPRRRAQASLLSAGRVVRMSPRPSTAILPPRRSRSPKSPPVGRPTRRCPRTERGGVASATKRATAREGLDGDRRIGHAPMLPTLRPLPDASALGAIVLAVLGVASEARPAAAAECRIALVGAPVEGWPVAVREL